MKLKYHKIPKVEKSVCTAEQMVAYNAAWRICERYNARRQWKNESAEVSGIARADYIMQLVHHCMKEISYDAKIVEKYDVNAIESALRNGMKNYLEESKAVFSSYEEIGEIFPAYL